MIDLTLSSHADGMQIHLTTKEVGSHSMELVSDSNPWLLTVWLSTQHTIDLLTLHSRDIHRDSNPFPLVMEGLTEKQLLGVKMMNEFFGEDLFNALRSASVGLLGTGRAANGFN